MTAPQDIRTRLGDLKLTEEQDEWLRLGISNLNRLWDSLSDGNGLSYDAGQLLDQQVIDPLYDFARALGIERPEHIA